MGNKNNSKDLVAETINNGNISFLSELLINQSFVSDEERKDDTTTENTKQTTEINTNEYKSFISDILKILALRCQHHKRRRKESKIKINQ